MIKMRSVQSMCVVAAGVLLLSACSSTSNSDTATTKNNKELVIGFNYDGTGPFAGYDIPTLAGMKFAANQINASGGPIKIKIAATDNNADQATGLSVAQSQIDQHINAFVMTTDPMNIAVGTAYAKSGAVVAMGMVSPPTVREAIGDHAFSISEPNTNAQAAAMAGYACSRGYKKVFVLNSQDMEYLARPGSYFLDAFSKDCGGVSAGDDSFKIGQADFSTQVTKAEASGADAIFSPMFMPDTAGFLKRLRGSGSTLPFLGMDGLDTPAFTQGGGASVEGAAFATAAFNTPGSQLATFFAEYKKATGKAPESNEYEAVGRDNVYAYLQAAKNVNYDLSPDALARGFAKIKDMPLATGTASMDDATNTAIKPVAVVTIKNGIPTLVSFTIPSNVPKG